MVTLSLFRHAKSSWDSSGLSDFDRPLAPRGEKAAPLMGRYMANEKLVPDIVLCSPAARARQTYELASAQWAEKPECNYEDALYMASPAAMLSLAAKLPGSCAHAMIVAHNPGLYALAVNLARSGDDHGIAELQVNFPTAALAVLQIDGDWSEAARSEAVLERFVTPKSLA